jgi:hypothetical protein
MSGTRRGLARAVAVLAVAGLVGLGLVASAGAQSGSVPGVTAKSVKVGYIYAGTGVAA